MKHNRGVGIDAVDLEDFKTRLNKQFLDRILSEKEQACYDAITHPKRKLEYAAGRFAVKEAYVKAMKKVGKGVNFRDISVLNHDNGAPYIDMPNCTGRIIDLSITHTAHVVMAIVMIDVHG